ncbi:zinc ribbon domain-containing protein [Chloroflexota bacterium]
MDRALDDDDLADIEQAMALKGKWDNQLREKRRQEEQLAQDLRARQEYIDQDLKKRWAETEQQLEKSRLEYLQKASVTTLMAIAKEPAQLEALFKTARLHTLAGLPPDQAALLMMEGGAFPADVAREIIVSLNDSGKIAQYERLISEMKESAAAGKESSDANLRRMTDFFNQALGTIGAVSGAAPAAPVPAFCPSCGKLAQPGNRFCQHCGTKL